MVSFKEISGSLYGVYLIARRDKFALDYFNISMAGFYNSFAALALALPLFALENAIDYKGIQTETGFVPFLLLLCLALVVSWGGFLLVLGVLARYIGFFDRFSLFVTAYNWAQLALVGIWLPLSIITSGLFPPEMVSIIYLLFIGASYVYLWQILRITLNLSSIMAAGFAFLEFLIAVLTQAFFSKWLFSGQI